MFAINGIHEAQHSTGSRRYGFAGLVSPGEFQVNVAIPAPLANGDQPITATYGGALTQPDTLITIHN